ncbi:hypothetical protein L227DRAFT_492317 [Lentinus tigrinus ALCF2SS1-6]|uniref:Mitochondrial distribution and morphology protein 12 n=1 Tax=Lentinus tigrinus ALCF2SS1-6 TaxID=1328759 RepID=A0A5C2SRN6_9APHY|nr:hypothetical protein L227DRAFT_492317 [Lentinus tigrinus ALCF2SS1-6]
MSIDLEWNRLDSSLASTLVDLINRQLASTARPSFIGPIEVTSFDFGATAPDVELVDLRDIYRDFLEDDEEDENGEHGPPVKVAEFSDDDDGFEWVSRKAVRGKGIGEDGPAYHLLPPHMRYGMNPGDPEPPASKPPQQPDLQLHLHITWHSNLRLTLTTSLLINYPSPMFMSLPIKLSVTGLLFNGEVVVAYEGERKRVHLCIPLPIGQRLLPTIYIESEIGQADKHVLKNVTRVERFIQDVIRKTVEEELVFPNFQTFVLGDQDA